LGKPLCKAYTLTNWRRRPLYKNQIHYAALDAVVVIKIWEILKAMPIPELAKDKKPIKGKK
jgi:ribonuclease D